MSRRWRVLIGLASALAVSSCSAGPSTDAVEATASRLAGALANGDFAAACALLMDTTRSELESDSGKSCADAIGAVDVPTSMQIDDAEVYGVNAIVRTTSDVLFLSETAGEWRVVAAGCQPRPVPHPYDCTLKAG